jgi:Ku70/Ku80 beta-barrel domain
MDEVFGSDTSGLSLRSWRIIVSPRGSELLNLSSHLGLGSHRKAAPGAPLSNGGRNGRYTRRSVECICSHSGGRSPTRCGLHYQYLEKITCSPPGGLEEIHIYELSKGRYVEIEEDELQAIEIESTHTVDIDSFVPFAEIDKRYLDKPYYITPDGKMAAEAFVVP